jgi:hypothetical protein
MSPPWPLAAENGAKRLGDITRARRTRGDELPFAVRANPKNLIGCLKGTAAGAVTFAACTPAKPFVVKGAGDRDCHLIVPIKPS